MIKIEQEKELEKPENQDEPKPDEKPEETEEDIADRADKAADRLEAANIETRRLEDVKARREARARLGGHTDAGAIPPKKKVLTDTEYAEALERGEVNPLKEDGLI